MEKLYVNNNGTLLENEGTTIEAANRGYLYGDGLFESIRVLNGRAVNLDIHIMRLKEAMTVLKMRIPQYFTADFFEDKITELIEKSHIKEGGKVRLSVDRTSGGTYRPLSNEVSFFIEVYPLKSNEFVLNTKGWEIDLFTQLKKQKNILSNFKTKNALISVLAAIEAKENDLDDLLLTDVKGSILEASSSNLFLVSNGVLYTPGLEEGCVGGTMRMTIINIALENNVKVYESGIMPQNLLAADEVFLTNAINGITWVQGYRTKRYKNEMAMKLVKLLNNQLIDNPISV